MDKVTITKAYYGKTKINKPAGWKVVGFGLVLDPNQAWINGNNMGVVNTKGNKTAIDNVKNIYRIMVDPCEGTEAEIITDAYFSVENKPIERKSSWFDALPDVKIEVECQPSYMQENVSIALDGTFWMI